VGLYWTIKQPHSTLTTPQAILCRLVVLAQRPGN